jgi:predicted DNA binding CopG/RHH family protein
MPKINRPSMVLASARVPEDLWERVKAKAAAEKLTVSQAVRAALELYAPKK